MPAIQGVIETALYVADLDRSAGWYEQVLGFRPLMREGDRLQAMSVADRQVLLLFRVEASTQPTDSPGGRIPPHDGQGNLHLAFAVAEADVEPWVQRLVSANVPIESRVTCGGQSVYFRDPDGHLIELISPGCWPIY